MVQHARLHLFVVDDDCQRACKQKLQKAIEVSGDCLVIIVGSVRRCVLLLEACAVNIEDRVKTIANESELWYLM